MKASIIFFSGLISVIFSSAALAHTDHALGEGSLHLLYHLVFWSSFTVVVYKGICWFKANKKTKAKK